MTSRLLAERGEAPPMNTKKILVAIKKVPMYTPIKEPEKFFIEKDVPEDAAPKKALTNMEDIRGKKLNKSINEEAFVYAEDLLDPKSDGMAAMLSPGQRAVAIKVNPESLVGGFVLPGTRVDVISTIRRGENESESKTILQDMLVLAVDTKNNKEEGTNSILGQTVTLAVKPEEAQQISLASAIGELRLALRAAGDSSHIRVRGAKAGQLGIQRFDSDSQDADGGNSLAPTPVPAILPPLPPKAEAVVETPKEEPPPVKTHTLTVVNGEHTTKHVFVADTKDGWKSGVQKTELEELPVRRTPTARPDGKK
jgi:pilus assembly protein CpaB